MGLFDFMKKKAPDPVQEVKPKKKPKPKNEPKKTEKPKRVPDPEELIVVDDKVLMYLPKPGDEPDAQIYEKVNLTEKAVLIDVPHRDREGVEYLEEGIDFLKFEDVDLWEQDGVIRGLYEGEVLFEISKRSKAYKELLRYVGRKAKKFTIWEESSAYGKYYQARLWFDAVYWKFVDDAE